MVDTFDIGELVRMSTYSHEGSHRHEGSHSRRHDSGVLGRYDYPTRFRIFELVSVTVFVLSASLFVVRLASAIPPLRWTAVGELVLLGGVALLVADFLSGLVHFLCDNLGTADTPIVGRKFIQSFRDHHSDPQAMTRGDWVSVNADNLTVCLPVLVPASLWLDVSRYFYASWFLLVLTGFIVITNQAHKWAHLDEPPVFARLLQKGLLLSPENHRLHHIAPYDRNYCITSGVLNPLLNHIGFWPWLLKLAA